MNLFDIYTYIFHLSLLERSTDNIACMKITLSCVKISDNISLREKTWKRPIKTQSKFKAAYFWTVLMHKCLSRSLSSRWNSLCWTRERIFNHIMLCMSVFIALSDETKKFHRDRYRDFFSRPKVSRPRLFFETKYFRDRYWDFFSRPNVFETDTETFFRDQMFSRPIPRLFLRPNVFETDTQTFAKGKWRQKLKHLQN